MLQDTGPLSFGDSTHLKAGLAQLKPALSASRALTWASLKSPAQYFPVLKALMVIRIKSQTIYIWPFPFLSIYGFLQEAFIRDVCVSVTVVEMHGKLRILT